MSVSVSSLPVTIALVNDDEVVIRGLDAMLSAYSKRLQVVRINALKSISTTVDILLYDTFRMGQGNGPAVSALIAHPRVSKVVVYTNNFHPWLAREIMDTGVCGYLSKSLSAAQLVEALHMINAGKKVLSPTPLNVGWGGEDWPGRGEGLSSRESEILSLITMGLSNSEICDRTSLSINSIKSYIRSCYRKIDVDSRSQAVLWGVSHGLRADQMRIGEFSQSA